MSRRTIVSTTTLRRIGVHRLIFAWTIGGLMLRFVTRILLSAVFFASTSFGQLGNPSGGPLRVGIVGLVHGHVHGFLAQYRQSPQIEIVGVAEPDRQLLS